MLCTLLVLHEVSSCWFLHRESDDATATTEGIIFEVPLIEKEGKILKSGCKKDTNFFEFLLGIKTWTPTLWAINYYKIFLFTSKIFSATYAI